MRLRWIFVIFLLGTVVCVSAAPRADVPETTFNEADAPVNLAPPSSLRVPVVAPAIHPIHVPPPSSLTCAACVVHDHLLTAAPAPSLRHRTPLQNLLCTFLI